MNPENLEFARAARIEDIPPGTCKPVDMNGRNLLIAHLPDGYHAVQNRCSHAASPLDSSRILKGGQVLCPLHGARFDLKTGAARTAPAFRPIPVYPVRVVDGWIEVAVPRALATAPRSVGCGAP